MQMLYPAQKGRASGQGRTSAVQSPPRTTIELFGTARQRGRSSSGSELIRIAPPASSGLNDAHLRPAQKMRLPK